MPAYITPAADKFDYDADWKEVAADSGAQVLNLSNEAQEGTLQAWVPWNKQLSAARHFLGFAYADAAAPWKLRRENPARHPVCPWLRCCSFSTSSAIVKANTANPNNEPYIESSFDPELFTTYYKWVLATAKFRNFRNKFREDAAGREEWERNVYVDFGPKIEALSADGLSQLKFAETSADSELAIGTPFPAPLAELLAKADFFINWTCVPWDYVSSSEYYFYPRNIIRCLGRVNSDEFMDGYEPGTVLMTSVEGTEFDFPVPSDDIDEPLKGFHVRIGCNYFQPTQGAATPVAQGHNTFVWRKNGKYYYCSRDGSTNLDRGLYQQTAFAKVFEHVEAP